MTAWLIPVDKLERCPGACGRLICDAPDCHILRRLANGEFYVEPGRAEVTITPETWAQWEAHQRARAIRRVA